MLERAQWGRVGKVTEEGGREVGVPQALTSAIFNWCETGSAAEGAKMRAGWPSSLSRPT